jgi:putative NADPH-quinone reductase
VSEVPLVQKYQKMFAESDEVVFLYPIWWGSRPAILQGFIEKVFLSTNAWESRTIQILKWPYLRGKCTWIKRVNIFTTGTSSRITVKFYFFNAPKHNMVSCTLKALRMRNIKWLYISRISVRPEKYLKKKLNKVYKIMSK